MCSILGFVACSNGTVVELEIFVDGTTTEVFANHAADDDVTESQCMELVDLFATHVEWAKDHATET